MSNPYGVCSIRSIDWQVLVGHAIHVAWGWLMFTGSTFSMESGNLIDVPLLPDPLYTLSLGANACTLLAFAVLYRRGVPLFKREGVSVAASVLMCVGTFMATRFVGVLLGQPTALVEAFAGLATGMGTAIFLLLWGEVFVSLGARRCLIYFSASSLAAAAMHIAAGFLPVECVQAAVSLFPLVEIILYRSYISSNRLAVSKRNSGRRGSAVLPANVVALGLFFGFSFGTMRGFISLFDGATDADVRNIVSMVFVMLACVLAYSVSIVRKVDFGGLIYRIALPLVALGFLFIPLSGAWSFAGTAAYRMGYEYVYIILWMLWVFFARRSEASSTWILACGLASVQMSKFVGFVVSADIVDLWSATLDMGLVSSVALFLILLFALFSKESRIDESGWEEVRPAAEKEEAVFSEQSYAPIADILGLSPRETEVFYLLLRGRSRSYIAQELVVTEETVKSHVKGIYLKSGVHTKQDLIDRVEAMMGR